VTEAQFISRGSICRRQSEGDVDDHVLLAADEAAATAFHQDLTTGRKFTACTVDRIRFSGATNASISTVCEVLGGFSLMHQLGIAAQPSEV
jgi:hypothetical protein